MYPLEAEPEPLTNCWRCGNRVAPPTGPSFVYRVGLVGFQGCAVCGARWRCLWSPRRPRRRIPARAVAVAAAVAIVAGAGVAAYATTRSSKEPRLAAATRGARPPTSTPPGPPSPAGARYLALVAPGNAVRADVAQFLAGAPSITPPSVINRRIAAYAAAARRIDHALSAGRWPTAVAPRVQQLVAADRALTADLLRSAALLNQTGFSDKLQSDAALLHIAANGVRASLRLLPAAPLDDARFSLV